MIPANAPETSPGIARFQCSVAGICVALMLVGGLITVPTTCECGTGIPHGHSIFILPGHHHGTHSMWTSDMDAGSAMTHDHAVETAAHSGPQLAGKVAHGADRLILALATILTGADAWQKISYPALEHSLYSGPSYVPDAPPPQDLLHS